VIDVQQALRRRGYYHGSIDGDAGPGTRGAIRAYQDDRGLAVTGRIDAALVRSLGIN
jgi:peptidoglycan hydrolase-like protein with peptidoglycan-binding domain